MELSAITGEHPADVLQKVRDWRDAGIASALIVVIRTQGGAVRAPGALMAVSPSDAIGYISGGCIDADVILQAREALKSGAPRTLLYGAGSPFVDLPLPCGGAIELLIIPEFETNAVLNQALDLLETRQAFNLDFDRTGVVKIDSSAQLEFHFRYDPKLRIRIAGRGADALALAKLSDVSGYETVLMLNDEDDISTARASGSDNIVVLSTTRGLPELEDDEWTAFVLLFHDQDWEIPLLKQALSGPAFYIGAVGSRQTHDNRRRALAEAGCADQQIERVHGPVGLVSSLRNATPLAISILAEIISESRKTTTKLGIRTAFVMLAAGAGQRFCDGDKLMADLNGKPVLAYSADIDTHVKPALKLAVVGADQNARRDVLEQSGWTVVENADAADGQSTSLNCALNEVVSNANIDQITVLLGDMPHVPNTHIDRVIELSNDDDVSAIMSEAGGVLTPPALFKRTHFAELTQIRGDQGAKSLFLTLGNGARTLSFSASEAVDIDSVADLMQLQEPENA